MSERTAKLALPLTFLVSAFILSQFPIHLNLFDYLLLALAATRLGRMIAFEGIFSTLRAPLAVTKVHEFSGLYTDAKFSTGWRKALGDLVTCTNCSSIWAILAVFVGLVVAHDFTYLVISILAICSAGEIINSMIEALCWSSEVARKYSGEKQLNAHQEVK
jgi:hypothetical protein